MKLPVRLIVFLQLVLLATQAFAGDGSDKNFPWLAVILGAGALFVLIGERKAQNNAATEVETRRKNKAAFAANAKERVTEIITNHIPTLAIKHRQTNIKNDYGIIDVSEWDREIIFLLKKFFGETPSLAATLVALTH
jgi:hypothetical protein